MNKSFLVLVLLSLSILFFSGCTSAYSTGVKKPQSELIKDSSKAYIMFSRSGQIFGTGIPNNIVEFDYETKELKQVGILFPDERIIYQVEPGKHYFYMSGGENDDYLEVSTKANHMYYVNVYISMGILIGRTYFDIYNPLTKDDIEDLESSELVEITKEAKIEFENSKNDYLSEINEDYPDWIVDSDRKSIKAEDGVKIFNK